MLARFDAVCQRCRLANKFAPTGLELSVGANLLARFDAVCQRCRLASKFAPTGLEHLCRSQRVGEV